MKIQFRLLDGKVLDVKKAFIFRINFDKEYLFYTTSNFNDEEIVPVVFGELIGPSMVKMASEDKTVIEEFLNSLAKDEVDNISNYAYIKYQQLDVTVLSGQKTYLPVSIINKYSYDFEVVMPEVYNIINDPTPEIEPVLEPKYIGNVEEVENFSVELKEEAKVESEALEPKVIPTNVTLEPKVIDKEEIVPDVLATKVYEQLVNSDPVDEIVGTLDREAIPLKINTEEPIYVDKEVFDKALKDVIDEPVLESIEESASISKEITNEIIGKVSPNQGNNNLPKKKKGKSFYISLVVYAILLVGIVYFGSRWLGEQANNPEPSDDTNEVSLLCETHIINDTSNRKVNSVNIKFENNQMIEIIETETYFFDEKIVYNMFKQLYNNDTINQSNGYRERYDYNDTALTVVHVKQVVKSLITLDEWISHVGLNTNYKQILDKYVNSGYVCK